MKDAYAVGIEFHPQLQRQIPRGADEVITVEPTNLMVVRFLGADLKMYTALSGHSFVDGTDHNGAINHTLTDYPLDGHPIEVTRTRQNMRAMSRRARGGRFNDGNRLRPARLQSPPSDMVLDGLVGGTVSGWGVAVERHQRNWYVAPYVAVRATEDRDGVIRPITLHARMFPPADPETIIEQDTWLFYDPKGEEGCVPHLFRESAKRFRIGTDVTVDPIMGDGQQSHYLFKYVVGDFAEGLAGVEVTNHDPQPSA